MNFIYIRLIALGIILALVIGVVGYIKHQNSTITELTQKNVLMNGVISEQVQTINHLQESVEKQQKIREELQSKLEVSKKDFDRIQTTLNKHNLTKIASKKPNLLEKKINTATLNILECFELASGKEIKQNEKNPMCPDFISH